MPADRESRPMARAVSTRADDADDAATDDVGVATGDAQSARRTIRRGVFAPCAWRRATIVNPARSYIARVPL